jgi:FAD/FMN-containing dehydrogenase
MTTFGGAVSFFYIPTLKFPEIYELFESTCKKYELWNEESFPCWLSRADRNNMNPYPAVKHIPNDPEQNKRVKGWWHDFHRELARRGAINVVTGPTHPREFLEGMGNAYELVKEIKRFLDPNNILNPGVLF